MSIRVLLAATGAMALLTVPVYAMSGAEVLRAINHDGDQTIEMPEAVAASAKVFQGLSKDGGLTVDRSETADRVSESDWAQVNKDHDKTLELDEWLTVTRARFNAADTKHTGKLDAAELDTPAGQSLVKMIVK